MKNESYWNEKQELLKGGVGTIAIRSESYSNEEQELLRSEGYNRSTMRRENYWNKVLECGMWSDLQGHHTPFVYVALYAFA